MTEQQLNPSLAAERVNRLLEQALARLRERVMYGARNLMQSGYPLGRAGGPVTRLEELQQLRLNHERNLKVVFGQSWEPDKIRAQRELQREQELMGEVMPDAQ